MTSVLPQHTQYPYSPRSTRFTRATAGILLNPNTQRRPFSLPNSSYPSRSNQHPSTQSFSSSASSEDVNTPSSSDNATLPPSLSNSLSLPYVSDDDHALHSITASAPECVASTSRRSIRFAPLPVPRRAVLITEHGEELPLPAVFDDDDPSISRPTLCNFPAQPSPSLLLGGVVTPKQLSTIITPDPSPRPPSLLSLPSSAKNRPLSSPTPSTATVTPITLSKRFLPSFWHKSDDSRRPSSRDSSSSRDGSPPSFGTPLSHWVSADASSRRGSTSSTNGAPLARARSVSSAPPKLKRMLNGRVYGARKHPHNLSSTNAFDNVPDKEPEFVEWGHGGMGSVQAGGMWAKVQSDQKLLIGHTDERGRRGTPASPADEDDGGGMGWVKKRREERERKKREEEAAREAASKTDVVSTSSPVSDDKPSPASSQLSVDHNVTTVTLSQPTPEDDDDEEDEEATKDESLDDESSCTEQEDDDAAEVRYLFPFLQPHHE